MRLLGYFAVACVALSLLQAAVKLAALLVLLGCFAAFIRRPRETIALVTTLGVLNLVALFPLAALGIAGTAVGWRVLRCRRSTAFVAKSSAPSRDVNLLKRSDGK